MLPKSIRWQLPLSYAAIALLAALALGLALILPLRSYYIQLERDYLSRNAREIGQVIAQAMHGAAGGADAQAKAQALAFLTQARVRVFDPGRQLILDSGPFSQRSLLSLGQRPARPMRPLASNASASEIELPPEPEAVLITRTVPMTGAFEFEAERVDVPGDVLFSFVVADTFSTSLSADARPGRSTTSTMLFINRSLYGFDLSPDGRFDMRRSVQSVEQPFFGEMANLLGYVVLSEGPAYGRDIVEDVARGWVIASAVAVLVAAGAGIVVSRRIGTPLVTLTDVTLRMAQGDLSARADVRRDDELGTLARSFNEMADRVQGTVTALQQFASDAAHEINTPLTALRTRLDLAERDGNPADVRDAREQAARLEQLAADLLDLSRIATDGAGAARQPHDLVQLVRESSESFASRAEQRGIAFTLKLPGIPVVVQSNAEQLRRAIGNLLDNAVKFTPSGGAVTVTVLERHPRSEFVVEDTGIGIPPDELPRLFGRFHRARNAAAFPGNGLGLAIAKAIIEQQGGAIRAESTAHGTRFTFWLPLSV
jgi:signal transduction histidine kinase